MIQNNALYKFLLSYEGYIGDIAPLVDWEKLCECDTLDEAFINKYIDYIWDHLDLQRPFSEEFIREHVEEVDWLYISKYQYLTDDFIREFGDYIEWDYIGIPSMNYEEYHTFYRIRDEWCWIYKYYDFELINQNRFQLSEAIIREFHDKVSWQVISTYYDLSDDLVRDFADNIYWNVISFNGVYNMHLWIEFSSYIDWEIVFGDEYNIDYEYDGDEIREYADVIDWNSFAKHKTLNESIIKEFDYKLDWEIVSEYQTMSIVMMREYGSKLNWSLVEEKQRKEFTEYIRHDHSKKAFMLCYDTLEMPVEAIDNI